MSGALKKEAKEALFSEQAAGKFFLIPESVNDSKELVLHQIEEAVRFPRCKARIESRI